MKPDYWLERWRESRIGFHRADVNPRLVQHQQVLNDAVRVLVPLCGKSVDLEWLAVHGFEPVGIELSELAAQAFFSERGITPERREVGGFIEYRHGAVAILVGDFFAATTDALGYFDAAYDRAALIALPEELRRRYAAHLPTLLAPKAKLLLITLYYDAKGGPPFSVSPEEVHELYAAARISPLSSDDARSDAPGPVERGATFVYENAYAIEFAGD
jgi:thiopurine S-methyltransferase